VAKKAQREGRIVDTALDLAAARGWRNVALADIAAAADLPLAELQRHYSSKYDILNAFIRRVDEAVLNEAGPPDPDEPARDRLFDVIMKRFDALAPHKEGVRAILRDARRDPLAAAAVLPQSLRSMAWMLEAAGIDSSGLAGLARTKGLAAVYAATMRVWLDDDSADMAKTMAALDARLRQAERWANTLLGRPRGGPSSAAATASG
jgi:AcrR family transcriptional regulator